MEKVLIIAKDPLETELMRDLLAGEFDLACFETEEQAMREIEQVPIYAVLEELRVAQASGFGLANRLSRKDWRAAIPVVAFSSSGEDIRHDDCLHRGISDFLLPPFSIDLAVKRIHNATRSKESFTFAEIESIEKEIRASLRIARQRQNPVTPFIAEKAQIDDDQVIKSHIAMFVNDFSENVGEAGWRALENLWRLSHC